MADREPLSNSVAVRGTDAVVTGFCSHFEQKKKLMQAYLGREVVDSEVNSLLGLRDKIGDFPPEYVWRQVSFVPKVDLTESDELSSQNIDVTAGIHFEYLDEQINDKDHKPFPIDVFNSVFGSEYLVFREVAFDETAEIGRALKDNNISKLLRNKCLRLNPGKNAFQITRKLTKTMLAQLEMKQSDIWKSEFHNLILTSTGVAVSKESLKKVLQRNTGEKQ